MLNPDISSEWEYFISMDSETTSKNFAKYLLME